MTQAAVAEDVRDTESFPAEFYEPEQLAPALSCVHAKCAPRVSVVVPALNEAESLEYVLSRIPQDVDEVVLVDGHSTDGTVEVAQRLWPGIRIVCQDGRGKGNALRCGFEACQGDIIVAIDADGSTNPREIPAFVGALLAGADFVKGTRFIPGAGTSDMTLTRNVGNRGFVMLVWMLFGVRYTDLNYGYTAFWARELDRLDLRADGFEIECEMNLRAAVTGMRVVEVASFEDDRVAGEALLRPIPDGWRVLKEVFRQRMRGWRETIPAPTSADDGALVPETAEAPRA